MIILFTCYVFFFFFSSRRRHTRCALVTGVQTCALPISESTAFGRGKQERHHCHEQGSAKARLTHRLTTGTGRPYRSVPAVPPFLCLVTGRQLMRQFPLPRQLPQATLHRLAESRLMLSRQHQAKHIQSEEQHTELQSPMSISYA